MNFRPKREAELDSLSDEELIAYIASARDSGHNDEARVALGVLAFRRLPDVRRRVLLKVPRDDADDVAMEAMASALKSAFAGSSVGEFVNLLHTITDRRVADFHRRRKPANAPLPEDHEEAEEIWGEGAISGDFSSKVDLQSVIEQTMEELSEQHRRVVDLYVFQRDSAKETAAEVNMSSGDALDTDALDTEMTEDNVHQIAKRFRDRLKELLEDARGSE